MSYYILMSYVNVSSALPHLNLVHLNINMNLKARQINFMWVAQKGPY